MSAVPAVLLGLVALSGLAATLAGAVALAAMRDAFTGLHAASLIAFAAPVGTAAAALPALLPESGGAVRLGLFVLLTVASGAASAHAIGRALHVRRRLQEATP